MKYLVFAALLLSGCASTAEKESRECAALGDRPGSPVYEDCMRYAQGLRAKSTAAQRQRSWDNLERTSQALLNQGAEQERRNRVVNCVSTPMGNQVNTTCY